MPPKAVSKCGGCGKTVSDKEQGIQCEICTKWFHCTCQGINDKLYAAIVEFEKDIHWFCKACRDGADKIMAAVALIKFKVDQVEQDTAALRNHVQQELARIDRATQQEMSLLRQQLSNMENNFNLRMVVVENSTTSLQSEIASRHSKIDGDMYSMKESLICLMDEKLVNAGDQTYVKTAGSNYRPLWSDLVRGNLSVQQTVKDEVVRKLEEDKDIEARI
jgi:ribosome-associated translation inhibitor RaiA